MNYAELDDRENYVLKYCINLMTSREKKILSVSGKLRLQYQLSGSESGRLKIELLAGADKDKRIEHALCGDATMVLRQIAKRILTDNRDAIKACPYCGYVLRTPTAKQCRQCFKSWRV